MKCIWGYLTRFVHRNRTWDGTTQSSTFPFKVKSAKDRTKCVKRYEQQIDNKDTGLPKKTVNCNFFVTGVKITKNGNTDRQQDILFSMYD